MLKIVVVDRSADSRTRIVAKVQTLLQASNNDLLLLPRIDIKPLSNQEIKFHAAPDVCIVGQELVQGDSGELSTLRKLLPEAILIVYAEESFATLTQVEHLARLGADEVITEQAGSQDFLRKLIMLTRRGRKGRSGKLIVVDSAKGGVGVTSLVAALGEALVDQGKKSVLVDFDLESQDLSRFLRARPFVNENLAQLLEQQRPVTEEFVEQSLVQVWHDEPNLLCLPPAPENDQIYSNRTNYARTFLSILEILDSYADFVFVDTGCIRGAMLQTIYRVADTVLLVINNDPAALFATVDRLNKLRSLIAPEANIFVVENNTSRHGLSHKVLLKEFMSATELNDESWVKNPIPFCQAGMRWPASGGTLFSQGRAHLGQALRQLTVQIGLSEIEVDQKKEAGKRAAALKIEGQQNSTTITGLMSFGQRCISYLPRLGKNTNGASKIEQAVLTAAAEPALANAVDLLKPEQTLPMSEESEQKLISFDLEEQAEQEKSKQSESQKIETSVLPDREDSSEALIEAENEPLISPASF